MAFISKNSPRLFFKRTTVLLSGLCAFFLFIMYISPMTNKEIEFKSHFLSSSPLLQDPSWNYPQVETEVEESIIDNIPKELQFSHSISSENEVIPQNVENKSSEDSTKASASKKILIWNNYWGSKSLWHKIFHEIVYKQCPNSNCQITIDHSELDECDAVIFHLVDIPTENYTFPRNRNPNQIWIGMTYEPPYILSYAGVDFKKLNGIFNRTMSYRTDGDIVVRHGTFSEIPKIKKSQYTEGLRFPAYASNWVNSHDSIESRNYAEGKRRLVAWFASSRNCDSQSGREKYIKELQNFVQVDIYGSCGPYKCGAQKTLKRPYKVEEDDCYMLVSVGYKFVLAFENSLCEDYVTEKLYNNLKLNVVPVVFGGSNYSVFAPPNSIIDASQYTPEELAQYLQILDKNDTMYNEYFRWKKDYMIEAHDGVPLACDLCEQLNNPNYLVERKVYDKFDKWIVSGCRKGYGD